MLISKTDLDMSEECINKLYSLTKKDLTDKQKNDIFNISTKHMSFILDAYEYVSNNTKDYSKKIVTLKWDNSVMSLDEYNNFIKQMLRIKTVITDIQKTILGEEKYNQAVYAINIH